MNRSQKGEPGFVMPMLATRVQKLPSGPEWEYEVKWDGYRILAVKSGSNVQLFSRRRTSFTDRFEPVTKAVAGIHAVTAVLDGEVVATDARGQPSFQELQNWGRVPGRAGTMNAVPAGHQLVYYAFDLLFLEGQDLKRSPLAERRAALPKILEHTRVLFSAPLEGSLNAILKAVRKHKLEGVVAKRVDSSYEPGRRSRAWQKLPLKSRQEFVVGAYRPDAGKLELILVGQYEDGKLLFGGKVRQGLNPGTRRKLLTILKPLSTGRCPFGNLPSGRSGHWGEGVTADELDDYVWLKPEIVVEVKFTEWTSGGVLRHAEFVGLREDKEAGDVVREF
jgi:bifunctional non-homologous end joining protein LigD